MENAAPKSTASLVPAGAALPGTLLAGRYQVLKHLASGGMAELYLARATGIAGFERYVVVKKILPDHARDQRFVNMFLDEARLAAQLHHTNIAQVYDIGEDSGTYFFAMEYVHGEDARALLRKLAGLRRYMPTEHALAIVGGAAAGLHYAHEARGSDRLPMGLVHRDVSPSNVLVAYDGAVKLVDFGIAKAASRATETRSGTLKGKVAYMSPEQCLGKPLDRRSDVFSLGIVLYELTTLTRLFKFENDYTTMHQIVTGHVIPPTRRRADYPVDLEPIVMKCLAREPEARWQSAGELLDALERFAADQRLVMSQSGLSRFVRELFGERPEPWLESTPPAPRHVSLKDGDLDDLRLDVTESQVAPARDSVTCETVPDTHAPVSGRRVADPGGDSALSATTAGKKRWPWVAALIALSAGVGGAIAVRTATQSSSSSDAGQPSAPEPSAPEPSAPVPSASAPVPSASAPVPVPVPVPVPATTAGSGSTPSTKPEPTTRPETARPKVKRKKDPVVEKTTPAPTETKPTKSGSGSGSAAPQRDPNILIRPSQKKDPANP